MKNSNKMKINKVNNLSEPKYKTILFNSDFVEHFYKGYLGKLVEKSTETIGVIFETDSPFGDGRLFISYMGAWFDEATGESGNMADFLFKMFPLMTVSGGIHAVFAEYIEFRDYSHKIEGEIEVKDELEIVRELAQKHGIVKHEYVNGFRVDTIGIYENGDVHYSAFDSLQYMDDPDYGLCQNTSYRIDASFAHSFISFIFGVQKIDEHPDAKRIYFVENPLQQAKLSDHVDAPVYIRPIQESYYHNDYNRLVKGKEVLLAKKVMPGPFELEKLEYRSFDSDENVDFFTFYGEEMPKEQDWKKDRSNLSLIDELLCQRFLMAEYLQKPKNEFSQLIK